MPSAIVKASGAAVLLGLLPALPAAADPFSFSTGNPDGLIATLSRPAGAGHIQTETADDFTLPGVTSITSATFTGSLPTGAPRFEHYQCGDRILPPVSFGFLRSLRPGNVPTRAGSPADVEIASATREFAAGTLTFTPTLINPNFPVANSLGVGGIPAVGAPGFPFTGGQGPTTGEEVQISVDFIPPVVLGADAAQFFFRPEVELSDGAFLWLSAPKPIPAPADLQSWTRNDDSSPGLAEDRHRYHASGAV